jgi:uncharacterized cupin superfamily protein
VQVYGRAAYGLGSQLTALVLPAADEELSAQPIPELWIEAGAPRATARFLAVSGDRGLVVGVWECSAGSFRWHFECDEVVYVLSGGVEVEHAGERHLLEAGSLAFFPVGAVTRWHVAGAIRKLFVQRYPTPHVRRLLRLV